MSEFNRLQKWFGNPLFGASFLFHSSAISVFTNFNLLLQREEPTIHLLKSSMENLGEKLAQRIVKPYVMREISSIKDIDVDNDDLFKDPQFIFLGGMTKATLNRLLNEGIITEEEHLAFHNAVQNAFLRIFTLHPEQISIER